VCMADLCVNSRQGRPPCQQLSRQICVFEGRRLCVDSCHSRPLCAWQTFVSTAVKADLHANSCQGKPLCVKADVCVSTAVMADLCVNSRQGRPPCQQLSRQTFVCKGRRLCVNSCHSRPLCAWQTFVSTAVKADLHANSCQGKLVCLKADLLVNSRPFVCQ